MDAFEQGVVRQRTSMRIAQLCGRTCRHQLFARPDAAQRCWRVCVTLPNRHFVLLALQLRNRGCEDFDVGHRFLRHGSLAIKQHLLPVRPERLAYPRLACHYGQLFCTKRCAALQAARVLNTGEQTLPRTVAAHSDSAPTVPAHALVLVAHVAYGAHRACTACRACRARGRVMRNRAGTAHHVHASLGSVSHIYPRCVLTWWLLPVLAAVANSGNALQYAAAVLQADEEVVLAAAVHR